MDGLSLWQPWASLIAIGAKHYETRDWKTAYRGPLLIHASRSKEGLTLCRRDPYDAVLRRAGIAEKDLPLGAGIAIADLVEVQRTEEVRELLSDQELAFGNYADRRFAWRLENVRVFPVPVPMKGDRGVFEVDPQCVPVIREQMMQYHKLYGAGLLTCPSCGRVAPVGKLIIHAATCAEPGELMETGGR